uniref:Pentatricopeptide repeat-containing protein At1g02370 n=1 Tax=Rhizophora mucronata TaxID=61149 RepID=A0A2P2Q3H5_RHIMU
MSFRQRVMSLKSRHRRWLSTATEPLSRSQIASLLLHKLAGFGDKDASKVAETLDEWVKEGKPLKRSQLLKCVAQLRKFKKYGHALQVHEWLEKSWNDMSRGDFAVRIDLLCKNEGVAAAEKYFNSLMESEKSDKTYGALLCSYCKEGMVDKATELFETMKVRNVASTTINYNILMSLYMKVDLPEKVILLAGEMRMKHITPNSYTLNYLVNSYAALANFEAAEVFLGKLIVNGIKLDWSILGNLASIYVEAGLTHKAHAVLQEIEVVADAHDCEAFHSLIILYGRLHDLPSVIRVWESLKLRRQKLNNVSYLTMLSTLSKLNAMDILEKCFIEWELCCSQSDIRVANVVLESYLKENMIEKAMLLSERMLGRGVDPNLRTLDLFVNLYLKLHQIDLALKYLETGASKLNSKKDRWFPKEETLSKLLKYLEEKKDVDRAEKLCQIMGKLNRVDCNVYNSLLLTYVAAGKVDDHLCQKLKEDRTEISPESTALLTTVCNQVGTTRLDRFLSELVFRESELVRQARLNAL